MRAHTITTTAPVGARGRTKRTIVPRGILALSLAVVLFAATASAGSAERGPTATLTGTGDTTPTPPAPPLTLRVYGDSHNNLLTKKFAFGATTSNDSTLVATGSIKRTVAQLAAGETTEIKARIKHAKRLNEKPKPGKPKVKVKFAATDEFGQTATDRIKVTVMRNPQFPQCKVFCTGDL